MPGEFEGGEKPKNFSEDEVKKVQDLIKKVREIVEWDLGAFCSTSEEVGMVNKAKDAMKEVEAMFDMPKTRFWAEPKTEEHKPKPIVPKTFLPDDMQKLRLNLGAIDEVISWDIGFRDETDMVMFRDARESFETLKGIL